MWGLRSTTPNSEGVLLRLLRSEPERLGHSRDRLWRGGRWKAGEQRAC
jgi:hypothetical protein